MRDTEASLRWITNILQELNIPFQIAGGLAANAYGATRELADIDIDIPEDNFELIKANVSNYITFGPSHLKTINWDLMLITLNHHGQEIDLSGAYHTKIFNPSSGRWHELCTDFSKSIQMELYGVKVPVIPREDLIAYKKILARPVDIADVDEIEKASASKENL